MPTVGWAPGVAGFIMTLVAIKYISETVGDERIFNNTVVSVIFAIGAIAVGTLVVLATVLRVMGMGGFVGPDFVPAANVAVGDWIGLALAVLAGLAIVCGLVVLSAVFLRRSYGAITARLNVGMFGTAGLLYLIGAAMAMIGIGFVLMFVVQILLVAAFFSIREEAPRATQPQSIPANR